MNKKSFIAPISLALLFLPALSFAQPSQLKEGTKLVDFLGWIINTLVLTALWLIAIAIIIIMFTIAGFKFLTAQGNLAQVAEARRAALWGVVGVVVVVLAWSIITLTKKQLGA